MAQNIYIRADNLIRLDCVKLASDGSYVTTGTMTWQLKNSEDEVVASGNLTYLALSNGRWQGSIQSTDVDDLIEGHSYFLEITISNGSGVDDFRRTELTATYHT